MEFRVGHGYDVHVLSEGESLILGGVHIPSIKGTVAHSDGDVLVHAICDSLLGSLALGDIGKHFPDTSSDFKGISSLILLNRVYNMVKETGWHISNIDSTLCLQEPKIASFISIMKKSIAEILELETDQVSIKATTSEKLGFVGRGEGVEAFAVVALTR
jgi:2-C-methyl-D-erythritol 2,4-cyclodiphosphate synthase